MPNSVVMGFVRGPVTIVRGSCGQVQGAGFDLESPDKNSDVRRVAVFGKAAKHCIENFSEGSLVIAEGSTEPRKGADGYLLTADTVMLAS